MWFLRKWHCIPKRYHCFKITLNLVPMTNDDDNDFLLTIIADQYILMVYGLWLGYSILGMKTVTFDKYIWLGIQHMQLVLQELLKSYTSLSPSGISHWNQDQYNFKCAKKRVATFVLAVIYSSESALTITDWIRSKSFL